MILFCAVIEFSADCQRGLTIVYTVLAYQQKCPIVLILSNPQGLRTGQPEEVKMGKMDWTIRNRSLRQLAVAVGGGSDVLQGGSGHVRKP